MIKKLLFLSLFLIPALGKAQYISSDNESNIVQTAYTDGSANDSIFIFCGPVVSTIKATGAGGTAPYTFRWYQYQIASHQFNNTAMQTNTGVLTSTLTNPATGGYKVSIIDANGTVIGCDIAWVWNLNYPVNAGADVAGCNALTLNGTVTGTTRFRYYNPPPDAFIIDNTTTVTVCFTANHTYVSDLGFYLVGPAACGSPAVALSPNPGSLGSSGVNNCNTGDNVNNLCFTTVPSAGINICTAPTPLTGTYSSYAGSTAIDWSPIVGCNAGAGGWKVQIFDCVGQDVGALTNATVTFSGNSVCGPSTISYNSGAINSSINDNSCTSATASSFNIPQPTIDTTALFINDTRTTTWTSTPAETITSPNSLSTTVNPFPTQNVEFVLTSTSTFGCERRDTMQYTYINLVRAIIDTVMPICVNASPITLTSTPTAGTWSGAGITNAATGTFNPALVGNDTATVIFTPTNVCYLNDTMQILINPLPVATASNTGPYCPGDSIFIAATGGVSYSWTGPLSFSSTTDVDTILNAVPPGAFSNAGSYTVTVTDANGCQRNTSTTVVVFNNPIVSPTNNGPVCSGDTTFFNVNSGNSYSWTGPNGFNSTSQNPQIDSTIAINDGVYTVTLTDANGCIDSATTTLVVNPLVYPTISAAGPICVNADTIVLSATPVNGTWSGNGIIDANAGIFSPDSAGAGNSVITYLAPGACGQADSITIIVNSLPLVSASNSGPYCPGDSIFLNATGTGSFSWTGPNSFTSSSQNDSIANAAAVNDGVYAVALQDGNGCIDTAYTTVVVNANPIVTPTVNSPVCFGDTAFFGVNAGNGYSWTGPNGFTSTSQSPQIDSAVTADAGVYVVTLTDANGCIDTASISLAVSNLVIASITPAGPFCINTPAVTLNATPINGTWSGNGITSSSAGTFDPAVAGAGADTIIYNPGGSCAENDTLIITVNAKPAAIATNTGPYCFGDSIFINGAGGNTYSWSGPNAFASTDQNDTLLSATLADTGTYTLIVTDGNGCQDTTTTNVTVNALPVLTAVNNGPQCEGSNITFISTGGVSYSWSGPGGFTAANDTASITGVLLSQAGIYQVTVTDVNGCIDSATTTLVVDTIPVVNATNGGPYCAGNTINLTVNAASNYSWSGPGGFTASTQNANILNSTVAHAGTYSVTITDANGCTNTGSTTVVVNALPTINPSSNSPLCANLPLNLTANGGGTYAWSGPNGYTSNLQNPTVSASATPSMSGTYTVTVTGTNTCVATASTTVVVNALPTITANSNSPVCVNNTLTLSSTGGGTYSWTGPNGFTSGQQNPTVSTSATTAQSGTYTVTVTGGNGCQAFITTSVTVNPLPSITATSSASSYCTGDDVTLTATGGGTYAWSGPGGYTAGSAVATINDVSFADVGNYIVTVTTNGCQASDTVSFTVNSAVAVNIGSDTTICDTKTLILNAGVSGLTYLWSTGENTQSITVSTAGTYSVQVTSNGCSSADAIVVATENCEPFSIIIPNIFTPNGDGQNDEFKVFASGVSNTDYEIFDRWGKKVYSGTGPWTGSGEHAGVFYYIITVTETATGTVREPYKGTVTLVK